MWEYTDKVREHYLHPRNVGEIEKPDGFGEIGNISCGDALRLTFKLDKQGKIDDIKFKTFGCGSAIASASVLTEMCKGKTLDEVKQISNKDIADALGGLPREKMHCSVMGQEALEAAVSFFENGGTTKVAPQKQGKIICTCFNITEEEIVHAITVNNLATLEDVTNFTKAGGACGQCHEEINAILTRHSNNPNGKTTIKNEAPVPLSNLQKIDLIRSVLTSDVKPILEQDGGDCELVDVDGDAVVVKFKGHCAGCALSSMTLVTVVEKTLREKVSKTLTVKLA